MNSLRIKQRASKTADTPTRVLAERIYCKVILISGNAYVTSKREFQANAKMSPSLE